MKVSIAQIAPDWLNKSGTEKKILSYITDAAGKNCDLIVFGEAVLPGYPFWLSYTEGAKFNDPLQKEMFMLYHKNSVNIDQGDLIAIQKACGEQKIACYLGCVEKAIERSGFSLYCSLVYINKEGQILSVHRKLIPTYEERLVWGIGDGNGMKTHSLESFTLGGLNCWENWMPLSRTALYAQGENLHIAVWPGSDYNTKDITRFIARESRSYVISASSVLNLNAISKELQCFEELIKNSPQLLANGGSCLAGPNGEWLIEPLLNEEKLIVADINIEEVVKERQNFDPVGHYSRPDVLSLNFNDERQKILKKTSSKSKG